MHIISSKVKEFILKEHLIGTGDRVLCALSGGSDSVAMTFLLTELSKELGFYVCAAHFNHKIRGAEADRDQEFSASLCRSLGIELYTDCADVPTIALQNKEGLEECARKCRYAFLGRCASERGATAVATAHHAADNTETVLFHLSRGSGIGGLGGIAPKRPFSDADGKLALIRPMLPCTKSEIFDFLKENGLDYVTDSTNADITASRNYLRAEVIPDLRKLNPSLDVSVLNLSETARCDEEFLVSLAERLLPSASIAELRAAPEPILRRYIRLFCLRSRPHAPQPEYRHVRDICDAIRNTDGVFRFSLPGSVAIVGNGKSLYLEDERREPSQEYTVKLECYGEYEVPRGLIFFTDDRAKLAAWTELHPNAVSCTCRLENGTGALYARSQLDGDTYVRGGHTRLVRKELNRIKLPPSKRPSLPRFCDGDGMIWVPYLPPADRARARSDNFKQLIYIGYTEN